MSGVVYFKFKSAISPDSVTFDGSFISVAELKNLIAARKGFGQDAGAELILTNPGTKEDYSNDTQQIPRQTTVHVRRVPTSKPRALQAVAAAIPVAAPTLQAQVAAQATVPVNGSSAPAADEFGADLYSEQAAASTADEEEARIKALQQGTAASWSQQVMQGGRGGRGRGRGGRGGRMPFSGSGPPPPAYFCNKCGQGGHWRENCPNEGEYKRVRAPAGIPMTRLMENKDGGLYAPDGTLVSLKPNEDAFLREMAGLPSGAEQASAQAEEPKLAAADAAAAVGTAASSALVPAPATLTDPEAPKPLLLDNKPHSLGTEPQLAGEGMFSATDFDFSLVSATNPDTEMTAFLPFGPQGDRSPTPEDDHDRLPAQLPRGPKEFIAKAFERDEPLSQADFEDLQDSARSKYGYRPKHRAAAERQSRSRSPDRSRQQRHHSRRRSNSLDRGGDRPDRGSERDDRGTDRVEGGRDSRFHRSSRHSGSPPRRRESDRRRSTSRPPAAHKASRSSSHRQPDNRWTRSQGHSTGGAASPAHFEDDGYQPYERGIEGDRWQPPDLPNNEVLIRPQPVDEEQEPDQQAQEDLLHEQSQGMEAAQAAVAPSPVKVEQDVDRNEDDTRPSERSRRDSERSSKRKRHHAEHAEPAVAQRGLVRAVSVSGARVKLEGGDEVVSPSRHVRKERAAAPVQVEPEVTGKLAGKTFTIALEESDSKRAKTEQSPSPSKDTSDRTDKKKKKHKKHHKKHKKHKSSKGKDRARDKTGPDQADDNADGDSSDDDTPTGRQGDSAVTRQLEHGTSVDQVLRHTGSVGSGHGNVTMQPDDDSQGRGQSLHASKAAHVAASRPTTEPTSDIAHASSQPDSVTAALSQGNSVKKSRALFGMAMGAVLRPGTLPGVKPKRK